MEDLVLFAYGFLGVAGAIALVAPPSLREGGRDTRLPS